MPRLDDADEADARAARLDASHMHALEAFRASLAVDGLAVPHMDPDDGGDAARLLILLETPGPGAAPLRFVSRDNPTGTARNLGRFMDAAGIARRHVLLWNSVPWIVHAPGARNRPVRRGEIAEGLTMLPPLLALLPQLRVVLLAGRVAAMAAPVIARERPEVATVAMPHPSPTYVCTSPAVAERITAAMREAAQLL